MHRFGVTGKEHHLLRYNAVFFLLQLAIADGALDREFFVAIMQGKGDGPIPWHDAWKEVPICRAVDRQGVVLLTRPMSSDVFLTTFKRMFLPEYICVRGSMHTIRRELGKQLDG